MARPAIAVVNSSSFGVRFARHAAALRKLGRVRRVTVDPRTTGRALARAVGPVDAVVASVSPVYDAAFFAASPKLRLLARHGIGVDNVDLAAAARHGVIVTKVPGVVEREAMAEHAVGLILAALRRFLPAHRAVAAGRWADRVRFVGGELRGRLVGLIGFGNIGSRTGEILARGFGARVLAVDPAVSAATMRRHGTTKVPLGRLLGSCHVISLHCSLNPTSRRIVSAAALRRVPRGTVLVNTARGELVDERAVTAALKSGRLAGLATDVVAAEPAGRSHPYLRCPNTLVVPHIGAYTEESLGAMGDKMIADLTDVLFRRRHPTETVGWGRPQTAR